MKKLDNSPTLSIPPAFAEDTITREGEAGRQWLAALPERIQNLCAQWQLVIDGSVMHGYAGLAAPVRRGEEPCVLRVGWLDEHTRTAPIALRAWNGNGAVRLLEFEPADNAMLLERLDSSLRLASVPIGEAVIIAGQLLRQLAIPAPAGLPTMRDMAEEAAALMPQRWQQYGQPMPRPWLDRACALALELSEPNPHRLVDYDLHYDDILASDRAAWLALDPKPISGTPEYGLAQLVWQRLDDMEAAGGLAHHFALLVEAAELDAELARAWTFVRCVDYWLWGLTVGLTYDPARCRRIVSWLAGQI
ncbi:MAG: aminoglycoside phosphotransferase family protein [Caldilineaceae bacterium]